MGQILSVHSYRGGTGKSNLTANLATLLASQGKRVGIVDTDIQSPGIHILFGLAEEKMNRALNDYLWGRSPIEETAYDVTPPAVQARRGQIFLIPSSLKAGEITRILREGYDVGLLNDGFQELLSKLRLDWLCIDTHPGLNEETLLSIAISDVLVLILRPDRQDFQGTAVTVDVARKLEVPRMLLVVNKAIPTLDLADLRQKVEITFDAHVAGVFPECMEMLELGSAGVFCLLHPHHAFTQELGRVVQQVSAVTSAGQ
jgi:MinD-like ATPase involved in chromosome partitioning or flagellar assembly